MPAIIGLYHNVEYEILRRYAKGHHRLSPIRLALEAGMARDKSV